MEELPRRDGSYYVVKSMPDNKLLHYDSAGMDKYFYEEQPGEWNWEIGGAVKGILGYECIEATTEFHGRKWTAWFAPEIPLQDGPWKLCGLPGLILEAVEEKGHHSFIADGMVKSNQIMYPIYDKDRYESINRLDMLKSLRNYRDNSNSIAKASTGGMLDLGPDAPVQTEYDFLETDYRL